MPGLIAGHAIKGFGGAILGSTNPKQTMLVLEDILGLTPIGQDQGLVRYRSTGDIGNIIDVNVDHEEWGTGGAGTVHHIAWRAKDFTEHEAWRSLGDEAGLRPTQIIDRQYFNAVYFREPGGILFEIATDPPGFARDEPEAELGTHLMLPEWYEPQREVIEHILPDIEVRTVGGVQ